MHRGLRNLALPFCLWLALTSFPVEACRGQVWINEILADPVMDWDGDGQANVRNDEWVEIVNAGTTAVALDSLYLADGTNLFHFGFTGSLTAGTVLVVYGSQSVAWESANGASSVGLSLNNAGDSVRLYQLSGADTLLVDEYTYGAHQGVDDRSTGRMPDGGSEWVVFDALNPYSGSTEPLGTGCPPTPGLPNGCPLPVEPITWSAVKGLYRSSALEKP